VASTRINQGRPLGLLVKIFPKLSETFILEEILGLERLGVPLRLYALATPTDTIVHPAVANVRAPLTLVPQLASGQWGQFATRHLRLFATNPLLYLSACVSAFGRGRRGIHDFILAGWLAAQLRDDGVEHLHTHFISTPADVAELVSQLTALPFSISAHAKDIYLSDQTDLKRKLEAASFTVTCTEFNRQTLASIAPQAIVHRMYHGVDRDQFQPKPLSVSAAPLILSIGRLREKKGLDTLIDACRILYSRGQVFRCEIIGYGEEHDRLQALIVQHGLSKHVQLIGAQSREQIIESYARTAVYVQPSRIAADGDRDGIPNVLLEAMAMSLPVVASKVSGIPELIEHGINGLLVEPDNPESFADAITHLLKQPSLGVTLGSHARARVAEYFDNDRNLKLLCQLLQDCHATNTNPSKAKSLTPEQANHAPLGAK
jgi:glycosyltransferase involved in cell wall biosynthesis